MRIRTLLRDKNILYADLILIPVSVFGSFVLRLDLGVFLADYLLTASIMLLVALIIKPLVYRRFGLYKRVWAYASIPEMRLIVIAVSTASLLVVLIVVLINYLFPIRYFSRSVLAIDWLISIFMVGAVRFAERMLVEVQSTGRSLKKEEIGQVLVVGAGDAGALVVRELQKNPQLNLTPVAFLDDDPEKQGHQIHGVPVAGYLTDLEREIDSRSIGEVLIAIPSAPGSVVRRVAEACLRKNIPSRTMPGIYELIGGHVSVNRLREVEISDLLRREPVSIDGERVGSSLRGKRVLVTGAGGSIASELCRQIARWDPSEMVLVGHGENSIFEILLELEEDFPSLIVKAVIADVRHLIRLKQVFKEHSPQVVFHAAAHKHVYLMEINVEEAVTNNILGTRNVVDAAIEMDVERLVMISTDKAVCPTSVMGATKRIAELIILDAARRSGRTFSVVRFGNVLGSRGSVVPLFKRQIARGGPVTITHPDAERFFMTIPEAVHLVLQASAMGEAGEVFILNMGEPVRILQLAEDLIRLSGLEPGEDIETVITGMKPGEKLSEELWDEGAKYELTDHPDITRVVEDDILHGLNLVEIIDELLSMAQAGDGEGIVAKLDQLVPGAEILSAPPTDLTSLV
jgi:FlaA1/EpsC-like NDP-sugar epimerase